MSLKSLGAILIIAAVLGTAAASRHGETFSDKARRDEIVRVPDGDPDMAKAVRQARSTLPEFLELAKAPRPSMSTVAVKVAVRDSNGDEFFWITPFGRQGNRFSGQLKNTPRSVKSVRAGQTITFAEDEIVDWMYVENGRMKGNHTACAMLKQQPAAEADAFKKKSGLECTL